MSPWEDKNMHVEHHGDQCYYCAFHARRRTNCCLELFLLDALIHVYHLLPLCHFPPPLSDFAKWVSFNVKCLLLIRANFSLISEACSGNTNLVLVLKNVFFKYTEWAQHSLLLLYTLSSFPEGCVGVGQADTTPC